MRNFKRVLFVMILAACLMACSNRPKYMDDTTYKLGCKALEVMDAYNMAEISKDDAREQLDEIFNRLNEREFDDDHFSQDIQNGTVVASIMLYEADMAAGNDLIGDADKLREKLGKK